MINIVNFTNSNYTCRITDENSSNTYTFVLDLGTEPTFDSNKETLIWSGDSDEQVNCEVTARPKAQV